MRIKVPKGSFEIVQKRSVILYTDPLGAGLAIGFINKTRQTFGLLAFLFPTRDFDLNLEELTIYSGETLFVRFQDEIGKLGLPCEECHWIVAGASKFRNSPEFLNLGERNLKIAETWLKRINVWERAIKKVGFNAPLSLSVLGGEGFFEVKFQNRVERYG